MISHYSFVPETMKDFLVGGITTVKGARVMSVKAQLFRGKPLSDIIYDINQEKVGKSSFFRYYVKGEMSHDDLQNSHHQLHHRGPHIVLTSSRREHR